MCGIAGALAFNDFKISESYINSMRDALIHRGPDGCGTWISEQKNIGLGHRRLAIIDLSSQANQPMLSFCKNYVIIFNGEIYNHHEIRAALQAQGFTQWQTDHSDTEVLLEAFAHWGIECLKKLRGMFAFALWDRQHQELWLVRDRIGIKPLYYSIHHNRITFASEIKALLQDPEQPRAMDERSLLHYLSFLTTPSPNTLFAGIHKLPNATWLKINKKGETRSSQYWDVWEHVSPLTQHSQEEIVELLRYELNQSVSLRQQSDVPVGVFLSGGIDSSLNTALFAKQSNPNKIKTFSIGYDKNYKTYRNEINFAQLMANTVNAEYHQRLLNVDDLIAFLPQMIQLQDEPIADPVCMPVYYLAKLAKNNQTTVCQVGEGADELFWGYKSWKIKLQLQKLDNLPYTKPFKSLTQNLLKLFNKTNKLEYELLRRSQLNVPIFWGGAEAFYYPQIQQLLSPRLLTHLHYHQGWEVIQPIYNQFKQKAWEPSILHWMSYLDLNYRLPELLLMRVDKMCMGTSLEARVPFLDHKLVELAFSIPSKIKTYRGISKSILKKAARGIIPDQIIDRKKQGFGVPIYEWFYQKLGPWANNHLYDFCKQTDYFNITEVHRLIQSKAGPQLWYLLNVALWWKIYIDKQDII